MRISIVVLAIACGLAAPAAALEPPLDTAELGQGRYARMHMLLERTFFAVNVVEVDMRFGEETAQRLRQLAQGQSYSSERAAQIASVATQAGHAMVVVEFRRDVNLGRFLEGVRRNLRAALEARMIDQATYERSLNRVKRAFSVLANRGFRKGDHLVYRVHPDSLRTVVVSADGETLLDQTERGPTPGRTVLNSYFAPGTDFREPLIRSLF